MDYKKVYVSVVAKFDADGTITPLSVQWDDGRLFEIDRVLESRNVASTKFGGYGTRYLCLFRGQRKLLFYDKRESRWFVEVRN